MGYFVWQYYWLGYVRESFSVGYFPMVFLAQPSDHERLAVIAVVTLNWALDPNRTEAAQSLLDASALNVDMQVRPCIHPSAGFANQRLPVLSTPCRMAGITPAATLASFVAAVRPNASRHTA